MLLSAVSVLVVVQSSSEVPEGLMNNSVYFSKPDDTHCRIPNDLHSHSIELYTKPRNPLIIDHYIAISIKLGKAEVQ